MLQSIKTQACPHCGTKDVQREERRNQHCSGEWNETREFRCGFTMEYSPNFRVERAARTCPHSVENKLRLQLNKQAQTTLTETIGKLGLDEASTKRLLDNLDFLSR